MAKLILICGKICSGKTTYAKSLLKEMRGILLSCDEITLSLFGQSIGENHDEIVDRTMKYLFNKSLEVLSAGINVVMDFGFWQRTDRREANDFYRQHGVTPQWHYVDVADDVWRVNLKKRNEALTAGANNDYYIDDNIAHKFWRMFEEPTQDEMDVWYKNDWV